MDPVALSAHGDREAALAGADLVALAPAQALVRFYGRHEALFARTLDASVVKPACRDGCAHCCNFKIDASALEVLAIAQFVAERFDAARRAEVKKRAQHNVAAARGLSYAEHRTSNQPCAFLEQGSCSVYSVRPAMCRDFHSLDVGTCLASVADPSNMAIEHPGIDSLIEAGHGTSAGFRRAVSAGGLDARVYDLESAYLEAIASDEPARRLARGAQVFVQATLVGEPDREQ